jgi:CheY-like chemotaxis protein
MTRGCVLVVDDSPDMREALRDLLLSEGYTPLLAVDGADALQKLTQVLPDLVITDLMMPRVDGIELISRVAGQEVYQGVSFILLTGSDIQTARERLQEVGLNCDVVKKPINLQDFLALVVAAVNLGHRRRRAGLALTPEPPHSLQGRPPGGES